MDRRTAIRELHDVYENSLPIWVQVKIVPCKRYESLERCQFLPLPIIIDKPWCFVVVYDPKSQKHIEWGFLNRREYLTKLKLWPVSTAAASAEALGVWKNQCSLKQPLISTVQWRWFGEDWLDDIGDLPLPKLKDGVEKRLSLYKKLKSLTAEDVFIGSDDDYSLDRVVFLLIWLYRGDCMDIMKWESQIALKRWESCFSLNLEEAYATCPLVNSDIDWYDEGLFVIVPFEEALDSISRRTCTPFDGRVKLHIGLVYNEMKRHLFSAQWTRRIDEMKWSMEEDDVRLSSLGSLISNTLSGRTLPVVNTGGVDAPCFQRMMACMSIKDKANQSYLNNGSRFQLATYLLNRGRDPKDVIDLFTKRAIKVYSNPAEQQLHKNEIISITKSFKRKSYRHGCNSLTKWCVFLNAKNSSLPRAQELCGRSNPLDNPMKSK